jgi:KaiC/GvpD/RAD55 family RecA-like ATPase
MVEKVFEPKVEARNPFVAGVRREGLARTGAVRVKTGIPGLDTVLEGGIPEKHVILVTGGPGCGKTTFGLQFAALGARDYGDRSLFVSFEQAREELIEQSLQFNWGIEELEDKGLLKILSFAGSSLHVARIWEAVEKEIALHKPARIVLDSLASLTVHLDLMTGMEVLELIGIDSKEAGFMPTGEAITRRTLLELFRRLKSLRLTALVITELPENGVGLSRDGVSEFLADGVIVLRYEPEKDDSFSKLQVRKMRGIRHKRGEFPTILKEEEGFSVLV